MCRNRLTTTVALFALGSFCVLAPGASASSTLLSGYGGPGEGNQAILGSTLVGGSGGGHSGSGGGGSAGTGSSAPQAASIEAAPASRPTPRPSGARHGSGASGKRSQHRPATANPRATGPAASSETSTRVALRPVSAPALGLSGTDIAYVVLAFLVLMLTAVVTVLLTRGERQPQGGPGEIDSR